jgi:hypothetical protein
MVDRGVFKVRPDNFVEVPHNGETMFSFLCSLCWPFIDSYYVTSMILFTLQPAREVEYNTLVSRAQWLGTVIPPISSFDLFLNLVL